eukprot:3537844-Amphidinium_carterae.1
MSIGAYRMWNGGIVEVNDTTVAIRGGQTSGTRFCAVLNSLLRDVLSTAVDRSVGEDCLDKEGLGDDVLK